MSRSDHQTWLVAYDIVADRRRKKVMEALERTGDRVNYSVFEIRLPAARLQALLAKLERLIDPGDDHVRLYPLDRRALKETILLGRTDTEGTGGVEVL